MKVKGFVASILVFLILSTLPVSVFAGTFIPYSTRTETVKDIASVGFDVSVLEDYVDLEEFRGYIVNEVVACNEKIDISAYKIPVSDKIIEAIAVILYKEESRPFNIGNITFSVYKDELVFMNITYLYTKEQYDSMLAECDAVAEKIVGDILDTPDMPEAFKALLIHDRLAVRCTYDRELQHDNRFDMYGALVEGYAVCEGYTKAYSYLLSKVGIRSEFCSSKELAHAWNIIYIDGVPYHVDVTWDDASILAGEVYHDNFLRSTEALKAGGSEFFANAHNADDYNESPQDTRYDNAFWTDSYSEIQYVGGEYYYLNSKLNTVYRHRGDVAPEIVYSGDARWNKYWNRYSRLSTDNEDLFFTTNTSVYHLDLQTGNLSEAFTPEEVTSSALEIYGFTYEDGYLICDLADTNNYFYSEIVRVKKRFDPDGMEIVTPPEATVVKGTSTTYYYPVGSELDTAGLELNITFKDGSVKRVTDGFEIEGADFSTPGKKTVTITWESVKANFEVEVYIRGDVNGDGKVTVNDATMIQKCVAALVTLEGSGLAAAEVTGDRVVSVTDATRIQKYVAGIVSGLG